ncbi:uncharacterized protein LOC142525628 [Primulina tabacum]|uniref:uncharacterized protein LOC142525628 n=1 Tax=Primulina tabacum TaxID=48773 RepID=UPI003F596908
METRLEELSPDDDEGEEISFAPDILNTTEEYAEFRLVGTFLTDRQINSNIMKQCLSTIWRPGKGITIREIGFKRFIFQLYHAIDLRRIMDGGPWTFDNNLLLLHHLKHEEQPLQVPLYHINFWVQIHDLPIGYMTEGVGKQPGSFIGKFLQYDNNNNAGPWKAYMRIRIAIDVRNPLKRYKKIRKSDGTCFLANFKYEKLGSYCFLCGRLGHIEKFCELLFSMESDDGTRMWGPWLRATDRRNTNLGENKWLREEGPQRTPVMPGGKASGSQKGEARNQDWQNGNSGFLGRGKKVTNTPINVQISDSRSLIIGENLYGDTITANYAMEKEETETELMSNRKRTRGSHLIEPQAKTINTNEDTEAQHLMQTNPRQHFLTAGPGPQACREP